MEQNLNRNRHFLCDNNGVGFYIVVLWGTLKTSLEIESVVYLLFISGMFMMCTT